MHGLRRGFLSGASGLALTLGLSGCFVKHNPIRTVSYGSGARRRRLLVMLPGLGDRAEAFARHGLVQPALEAGSDFDVVAVNAHFGYYREGSLTTRVHEDVLVPARARGYEEIWLSGVSLGGFGSLMTASRHQDAVDGMFVMAPYLGGGDASTAIAEAGGLGAWTRSAGQTGYEFDLWAWLRGYATAEARPPLYLGYGDRDDGSGAKQLLASALSPERVFVRPGGHKWSVWEPMWKEMLAVAEAERA